MSPDNESRRRHRGRDRGHGSVVINSSQIAPLAIEIGEGVFGHVVMLLPAMAEPIGATEVTPAHMWASPEVAERYWRGPAESLEGRTAAGITIS